ncbi:MAG: hypothetical protein DSZ28_00505 [Thiothrix sp.]|nr:MAG: hypothetical protein DSZ28_00505 [Thiothrix sp.]
MYQKCRDIFTWLKSKNVQYIVFRKLIAEHDEAVWCAEWGYKCIFSHGTANSAGVAVLINNNFDFAVFDQQIDKGGRSVILDIKTESNDLTLVNIHGPNEDNPLLYVSLWEKLKTRDTSIIMCGDWNVVQDYNLEINLKLK